MPTPIDLSDYLPAEAERTERIKRAESRVLRAFCRIGNPYAASHTDDSVRVGLEPTFAKCAEDKSYLALKSPFEQLVYMLDAYDGQRARRRYNSEKASWDSVLVEAPAPVRVPQHGRYRRSWLFSARDIPVLLLAQMSPRDIHAHIEAVRYHLMEHALSIMEEKGELWYFVEQELWQVPVHIMDAFRTAHQRPANRVKVDDRSVHGRPNRDRNNGIPLTSI